LGGLGEGGKAAQGRRTPYWACTTGRGEMRLKVKSRQDAGATMRGLIGYGGGLAGSWGAVGEEGLAAGVG
jgi:hypothetical protein